MTVVWLLFGFFREILFAPRSAAALERRKLSNRSRVLRRLRTYAFYRDLRIGAFEEIPIVDKATYLRNFDRLNQPGIGLRQALDFGSQSEATGAHQRKLNGLTIGLSTGTSGKRWAFVVRNREIGLWGGSILAKVLGWDIWRPRRIAFVFRTNSPLYAGVSRGWIQLRFFDLNADFEKTASALRDFQPNVLISVPNFFSRYLAGCPIREISPGLVICGADVLEKFEKAKIEKYFAVSVTEIYQATEGFLGLSCRNGHVHLNETDQIIEKLPLGRGRFVPIVTDVLRETQAIIRYQMDDVLVETTCDCGNPAMALERIEGRADQVLRFEKEGVVGVDIYPDELRRLVGTGGWYDWDYLIEQTGPQSLRIQVDRNLGAADQEIFRRELREGFRLRSAEWIETEIVRGTEFPVARGKRQRILRVPL